jgi:hypothetical protein
VAVSQQEVRPLANLTPPSNYYDEEKNASQVIIVLIAKAIFVSN